LYYLDHPGYCHNFQTFNLTLLYIKIEFNYHVSDFFISKCVTVVRIVDELGRIVIPIELRRTLDIAVKEALEIYVDGEMIILKKYEPECIFCGDARDVINYKGKNICKNCMRELKTDK
jgi:AbrB family transcriptional regulator, transcriptional pleiotropic regulator of transition state genes